MSVAPSASIVAAVGDLAIGFRSFSTRILSDQVRTMESVFSIHLGDLFLAGIVLLFVRGGNLPTWRAAPWCVLIGGLYGVIIIVAYSLAIPRIVLTTTVTLAIASQLILSAILDHYGFLGSVQRPASRSICIASSGCWFCSRGVAYRSVGGFDPT